MPDFHWTESELARFDALERELRRLASSDAVCWRVVHWLEAEEGFDDCIFYLRQGDVLMQKAALGDKVGQSGEVRARIGLPLGAGIVGSVAATGEAEYITDVSSDARYVQDLEPAGSEFTAPVLHRNRVIGVLDSEAPEVDGFDIRRRSAMGLVADLAGRVLGELAGTDDHRGLYIYNQVTADLARLPAIGEGDTTKAFRELTEHAARTLKSARVNIWLIEQGRLRCVDGFDLVTSRHYADDELDLAQYPRYAEALQTNRVIAADDARTDPRTNEFLTGYLEQKGVWAVLDAPIRVDGKVAGVLCVEQTVRPRRWTVEEVCFAGSLADFAAISLLASQKRAAEGRLVKAQQLDALGRLAGGVAHDFNNLLQVIAGSLEGLRAGPREGGDFESLVDLMDEATQRASRLTHQLLAFGRQQRLRREPVSVGTLLATVERLATRLLPNDVQLLAAEPEDELFVDCDEDQVVQALMNLVINAIDAMPDGGPIRLAADGEHGTVAIHVEDRGAGIPARELGAIFEPFYTTKGEAGHGLGLAMAVGVAQQHGGTLDVDSEPGQGTRFTLALPAAGVGSAAPAAVPS
ncbi:MAG: ATP-binding protein, partial [Pseudomonadota bacterium]